MLRPAPYPAGEPGWPHLKKYQSLAASVQKMNARVYPTSLNVNFDVDGPNLVGMNQRPCVLCEDCISGCNHSATNTVAMTHVEPLR